jgi:hypothetical protein
MKERQKYDGIGRPGKPVVWIVKDGMEFYYKSLTDCATALKSMNPSIKSSVATTSTMISLSCQLPSRKVAGFKFRYATEEEIEKNKEEE